MVVTSLLCLPSQTATKRAPGVRARACRLPTNLFSSIGDLQVPAAPLVQLLKSRSGARRGRSGRTACSKQNASQSQLFFDLMLVWQQLASRFSVAREGQYQAQLLLTALKLAIAAQRVSPRCPDGRYVLLAPEFVDCPSHVQGLTTRVSGKQAVLAEGSSWTPYIDSVLCRPQAQRAVAVAMLLSDLSASGVPVDAHSVAAAVVVDGVTSGHIPMDVVHRELGMQVSVSSRRHARSLDGTL